MLAAGSLPSGPLRADSAAMQSIQLSTPCGHPTLVPAIPNALL